MKIIIATHNKHKLAEMDKRICSLNGVKNICSRDIKKAEKALADKGSKSKKNIDRFGETYALQQARYDTFIDKGLAEAMMRKRKRSQNESIELATLLTESAKLLNN